MNHRSISEYVERRISAVLLVAVVMACGDERAPRSDTGLIVDTSATLAAAADSDSVAVPTDTTDSLARADTLPAGRLIPPGGYLGDSTDAQKSWFVMRVRSGITEIIPTKLALVDTAGPCGSAGPSARTARPLAINTEWIAMIADVPGLRAGAIDTATILSEPRTLDVYADSVAFLFRGERFILRSERVGVDSFRILQDGKTGRNTLYSAEAHNEGRWMPRWAGDLNRDGAPDIILEGTGKHSVLSWSLHMSGPMQANAAWRPAASYAQTGC